jgi:hypothetical protein
MNTVILVIIFSLALGFIFLLGYSVGFRSGMTHCFANIMTIGEIMGKKKASENKASAENANHFMKETSNS